VKDAGTTVGMELEDTRMTFDLDDPTLLLRDDVLDDPRPLYDDLRRRAPVWRIPGQDTYLVSDPVLIRDVVGRPSEFSSNLVTLLHRGADGDLTPPRGSMGLHARRTTADPLSASARAWAARCVSSPRWPRSLVPSVLRRPVTQGAPRHPGLGT